MEKPQIPVDMLLSNYSPTPLQGVREDAQPHFL